MISTKRTGNEAYLKDFPPEMITRIQGFPWWRMFLWALGVFAALGGAIAMLLRKSMVALFFWIGVAALLVGFIGHDLLLANGVKMYGTAGLVGLLVISVISIAITLYASRARAKG